jgi:hypothetical protein
LAPINLGCGFAREKYFAELLAHGRYSVENNICDYRLARAISNEPLDQNWRYSVTRYQRPDKHSLSASIDYATKCVALARLYVPKIFLKAPRIPVPISPIDEGLPFVHPVIQEAQSVRHSLT